MQRLVNADPHGKIALQGYDPVAFHAAGAPTKGDPFIQAGHQGYRYLFSSEENRATFERSPEQYLPAFGGYCAFGVGLGALVPVEIDTWELLEGRLVLQFSKGIKERFNGSRAENLLKAEEGWSRLLAG